MGRVGRAALAAAAVAVFCAGAQAQTAYPTHPVTLIVPYAPGGTGEILGRALAESMGSVLGEPLVVELKPGAGGAIGAEFVAKQARPDGYTVLFAASSLATGVSLMHLNFDPRRDLMPVAGVGAIPNLLSVSASGPLRSLADLVQAARAAPGQLSFGSSGPGTGSHLAGELFRVVAGIDITHVPYKGTGTVYPDLIAGRISMVFDVMGGSAISQVQGGRVRALALSSLKRSPALPAVPTFDEQGFPGFQFVTWFGFFVPAGTPAPVIARLAEATRASLATPGVIERMKQIAAEPIPVETAGFARYFEADVERWAALVREGKIARIQN